MSHTERLAYRQQNKLLDSTLGMASSSSSLAPGRQALKAQSVIAAATIRSDGNLSSADIDTESRMSASAIRRSGAQALVIMPPIGEEIVGTVLLPSQPRSVLEAVDQSSLAGDGSTRLKRTKAEQVQPVSSLRFTQGICTTSGSNSVEVPPKLALLLTRENVEARECSSSSSRRSISQKGNSDG